MKSFESTAKKFIHLRHKSGLQLGRILRAFPPRAAADGRTRAQSERGRGCSGAERTGPEGSGKKKVCKKFAKVN